MRTKLTTIITLLVLTLTMTGCWGNMEPQSTPQFYLLSPLYLNPQLSITGDTIIGAQDSLSTTYNTEAGMEYLDTIHVGDTVAFFARFSAEFNRLVSIETKTDHSKVNLWFNLNMDEKTYKEAFREGTDPSKGMLYFNPLYNAVDIPVYIIPTDAGVHPVTITITSDSQFPQSEVKFMMPVL